MRKVYALCVLVCLSLVGSVALAQRAPRSGTTTKTWTVKGTRFSQETVRQDGKVVEWRRRATGKDGITTITGRTGRERFTGTVRRLPFSPSETVEHLVYRGGNAREEKTYRSFTGKVRATIIHYPDGSKRTILPTRVIDSPAK